MDSASNFQHRATLQRIAHRAMLERGLSPDFPPEVLRAVDALHEPRSISEGVLDLSDMLWCSIDNDDSLDLDQLTAAQDLSDGARILIAIADVDSLVPFDSIIDRHARLNTTSVYTAAQVFPMLPERLSTNLTSLNEGEDRLAVVVELVLAEDGQLRSSQIHRALVHNKAKLAYNNIAAWLEGDAQVPRDISAVPGLAESLRLQDRMAQRLRSFREARGALDLETIEARPVFEGDELRELAAESKNRAKTLIEDFMIAANGVTARFLEERGMPSLRRVVAVPRRWDRIVQIAEERGKTLPRQANSRALAEFLEAERAADPLRFPDLSLSIIKLMGAGEYAVEFPGEAPTGHFGLAVKDYAHSTAPNRRYPDLITQRLLKAAIAGRPSPYDPEHLVDLARHCTEAEDDARRVERQVTKSAAALLLETRIGDQFDAIVTGITPNGTWVRLLEPPIEGRLERGFEGLDIGRRIKVQLLSTDVQRGYIDFKRVR